MIRFEKAEKSLKKFCVICRTEFEGYVNFAEPVAKGCCCDKCNMTVVIPARIKLMEGK